MKVSLIVTVLNAGEHLDRFLASIAAQTRMPDEVVIVDGGSSDGTVERLRAAAGVTVIEAPGANIARGRNLAIAHASHDVIAVADADCVYDAAWLSALLAPIEAGADVAMGTYEPVVTTFLDACVAGINLPLDPGDVDEHTFMPSARSVAFRRQAIDAVGGYPEWLPIGEDMWVDLRWREGAFDMRLAAGARARWRLRPTLGATWTQYFRYARGDGLAGMHPRRHALRFLAYLGLVAAVASPRAWPKVLAAVAGLAYARGPVSRGRARLDDPADRGRAILTIPGLMAFVDAAKMAGYAAGVLDRVRGRARGGARPDQPSSS
jgi:glycosyltransferase involved in cell wall biosynthesis